MKTPIHICFLVICLFTVIGCQQISILDDEDDRNCVAIIDSKQFKVSGNVLHSTIVEAALRNVHGNSVRVVIHGSGDTTEEFSNSIATTPCKVTSISIFSLNVAIFIKTYDIKLRDDTIYLVSVGNIDIESLINLKKYAFFKGKYDFESNVILVAGSEDSFSFSCGFISHFTSAKCVTAKVDSKNKIKPGIVEYDGNIYYGSSYATPIYAGSLLKSIMKNNSRD